MFGIRFAKFPPTTYVLLYRGGAVKREGRGLSFFYYAPVTTVVAVPSGSTETPFIFAQKSQDFQEVTVQGQVTYRITDPAKTAALLDFTLAPNGVDYVSDDPEQLPQRIVNAVQVLTQAVIKELPLRDAIKADLEVAQSVTTALSGAKTIVELGIEILSVNITAIKPTPETGRAIEAETREKIQAAADQAIIDRRNAAVDGERSIKENELKTEISVEVKKREVREAQMEAKRIVQEKENEMAKADVLAKTGIEEERKNLVAFAAENTKADADAQGYAVQAVLNAYAGTDPKVLQAISMGRMDAGQIIAFAFQQLAENPAKIGELNISPDLLGRLIPESR